MKEIDSIDEQIIALLSANGKMNNKEVATQIGLTVTPTFERIKRLERMGIIKGYHAEIDRKTLGRDLRVFCQVSLQSHQLDALNEFERSVIQLTEVESCFHVAGSVDYTLLVGVKNMEAYQFFLKNKLTRIPHIAQVHSNFVLTELKE
jgi:Lrp/AsnC family leucine-responsive transcriptional regulator